jgi:hypothetical protein
MDGLTNTRGRRTHTNTALASVRNEVGYKLYQLNRRVRNVDLCSYTLLLKIAPRPSTSLPSVEGISTFVFHFLSNGIEHHKLTNTSVNLKHCN